MDRKRTGLLSSLISYFLTRVKAGTSNFAPIAAMIAYMQGEGADSVDPATQNMDATLQALEQKYTSYGCYCWAKGTSNIEDLGAGSANVDWNDKACTDLYRYKK